MRKTLALFALLGFAQAASALDPGETAIGVPNGSYQQSCDKAYTGALKVSRGVYFQKNYANGPKFAFMRRDGADLYVLSSMCKGGAKYTYLLNYDRCEGDIGNASGVLGCICKDRDPRQIYRGDGWVILACDGKQIVGHIGDFPLR